MAKEYKDIVVGLDIGTAKIMAVVDGQERRIFGWDVPAASAEYRAFLEAFLPALRTALEGMGYDKEHVYYHISDEPSPEHLDSYRAAKAQAEDLLEGCQVIDALSSLEFYRQGLVRQPVPANDHIQPFIDAQVPGLWVYYCCAQSSLVPNRFFAMESARNRIMELGVEKIGRHIGYESIDVVVGGETAGIPFGAWIADRMMAPMAYVRKKPKGFGRNAQIEGEVPVGQRTLGRF